jgi:dihydropteroate synthase
MFLPKLWGILNITPDSFSDGKNYFTPEKAINHAMELIDCGAEVIDIGSESTRPGATKITWQEEWHRLQNALPVIKQEAKKKNILISLDSYKSQTIEKALEYIDIINDVSALSDPKTLSIVKESKIPTVLMHHLSIPTDISITLNDEQDPTEQVISWFKQKLEYLSDQGLQTDQFILDPGIGFGKKPKQSLNILSNIAKLHEFNLPIIVGHSRKGYLKLFNHNTQHELDINTALISLHLSQAKIQHVRVHNVLLHKQFFNIFSALNKNHQML